MEFSLALEGNLQKFYDSQKKAGERAVTAGVRKAGSYLKNEMQRQTVRAGLDKNARAGKKASKTWQSKVYPSRGASLGAASIVYSKWPKAMEAFEQGATIRVKNAKWLTIATDNVGEFGNRKLRPADFKGRLQFIPTRRPDVAVLVLRQRGGRDIPMFWLFKQTRINKKIDFYKSAEKWLDRLPGYGLSEWNKAADKYGLEKI